MQFRSVLPYLMAALAGFVTVMAFTALVTPSDESPVAEAKRRGLAKFETHATPKPLGDVRFLDAEGNQVSLADFRGETVLLNLWATWCLPCIEELPDLEALSRDPEADGVKVIAVSLDTGDGAKPRGFLEKHGLTALAFYHEPKMALMTSIGTPALPTTMVPQIFSSSPSHRWIHLRSPCSRSQP